jgi:DNA-binding MarR family transcriptional regulator
MSQTATPRTAAKAAAKAAAKSASTTKPAYDVGDFLCFAIYSAGHAFNRVYKPLLDALGLTYPQYLVMVALWTEDDQTVGTLGDKLFLESSTLTPLLKRLEALGLVGRSRDPADERQVRVRLTETGAGLSQKARDVPQCLLAASGMSLETLRRLQGQISTLRDNLLKSTG